MRTLEQAENWAREHSAVLKVTYGDGVASLQVGETIAYANTAVLEQAFPELVADLETQLNTRLTQPGPISAEIARRLR
jgi:hypothetical protein